MTQTLMKVSVITPCRNEARYIAAFLNCLLQQKTPGLDCEFLIADGMSDDGTREILQSYQLRNPRIRVIDNPERIVSTGLNRAILAAEGEIIVRMDVHTEYAEDYIAGCVGNLQKTGADNVGGPMRNRGTGYVGRAIAGAFHSPLSCGGAKFHREDYEGYVDTVTYGCWRKSTLLHVGLFDTALGRNQDDELNLRITRGGGKIWQSPSIVMAYHPRASLRHLFVQYFQYGFWKVAVIRKHKQPASWRHLAPGSFALGMTMLPAIALASHSVVPWKLWWLAAAIYALACVAGSLSVASRRGWDLLPILPIVFATYHFAYGIGFLTGLVFGKRAQRNQVAGNAFTAVVR